MGQNKKKKSAGIKADKKLSRKAIQKKLIREIKDKQQRSIQSKEAFSKLQTAVNFQRHKTHQKLFIDLVTKAGLSENDLKKYWDEISRRQKVQRRLETRGLEKIKKQKLTWIKKETKKRNKIRDRYWKLHRKKYKAREGNPELKFYIPIGDWTTLLDLTDRGMFGSSRGRDLGEYSYDLEMDIDYDARLRGHYFYPHVFIRTGDIENPYTLEVSQTLVLSHRPLDSDRGDFLVEDIRIDFSGIGHSRSVSGHTCPGEEGYNIWNPTDMDLKVTVHQFDYDTGLFLADEVISRSLIRGGQDVDIVEEVSLSTTLNARDFYVLNNGLDIYMHIDIISRVTAADEDGLAEINFSQTDTDGLYLGCTTLIGEYVG